MTRRFKPLPRLLGDQALAADPVAHAALSASAGTGKTQVLTARVFRLLLQGVPPGSILREPSDTGETRGRTARECARRRFIDGGRDLREPIRTNR